MGFEVDHTLPAHGKAHKSVSHEQKELDRISLIGNSFCCPVVAWIFGQGLAHVGAVARPPSIREAWGEPSVESARYAWDVITNSGDSHATAYVKKLWRQSVFRGCDIRLASGDLTQPDLWPRRAIIPCHWRWRVAVAYKRTGQHINVLELEAILASLRFRVGRLGDVEQRVVHFSDSQVCISVLVKGRSSSRQLNFVLKKINALVLASGLQVAYAYVRTEHNPADGPSRWANLLGPQAQKPTSPNSGRN